MHVSRENATFVPMKPKVVFRVFKSVEGETSGETNLFSVILFIKNGFLILSFTLILDTMINPLFTEPSVKQGMFPAMFPLAASRSQGHKTYCFPRTQ